MRCPSARLENCLMEERSARTMCNWKSVPHVCLKAILFNNWATGAKVSGVFWLLWGVGGSFQAIGEPFSSLLTAPVYLAVRCYLKAGCGVCVWQNKEPVPASRFPSWSLPSLNVMFSLVAEMQSHLVCELPKSGKQSWNKSIWLPLESIKA